MKRDRPRQYSLYSSRHLRAGHAHARAGHALRSVMVCRALRSERISLLRDSQREALQSVLLGIVRSKLPRLVSDLLG